jgi:SAM-dependent methyltransferase
MQTDQKTADAFATSWNNLPPGSVYTSEQVEDWFAPLQPKDFHGRRVLEMGCGNGSLLMHVVKWGPDLVRGIDLGPSVTSARSNLASTGLHNWDVEQADLSTYSSEGFDLVYSIGVLHHLKHPRVGFDAVTRNVKPGGRFHCWVYAREGNAVVIWIVDPIRRFASRLPWWITKYLIATPLVIPYFFYAKVLSRLRNSPFVKNLPLYEYTLWITKRDFAFFRHVAFDQLVTPQTVYLDRRTIEQWLAATPRIETGSTYVIMRNGNSWKFGGRVN